MTAPTPDAVAQAREDVLAALHPEARKVDALIAAVRAECAAKVQERERKAFRAGAMWVRDLAHPAGMDTPRIEREAAVLYPEAHP